MYSVKREKAICSYACISRHLQKSANCPLCRAEIDASNTTHLITNHTAAALSDKLRATRTSMTTLKRLAADMNRDFAHDAAAECLDDATTPRSLESINEAIDTLKRRRAELGLSEEHKKSVLLNAFFDRMISQRSEKILSLIHEIKILSNDKKRVNVSFYS